MRLHSIGNFDIEIKEDYYQTHKEQRKAYNKRYKKNHPEKVRKYSRKQYQIHKEAERKRNRSWLHEHPEFWRKHKAKRRSLGFIKLNESFDCSVAHHIDKIHVVYIPEKLHKAVYHNIWTGQGMKEINAQVFEWLKNI